VLLSQGSPLEPVEKSRRIRYKVYIDLHTSKAGFELKVVLLQL
jgi:hypothetical protein